MRVFYANHNGDFSERISFHGANVLTEDLGQGSWSLVFASQLAHHFTASENRDFVRRAAMALQPGGTLAIIDVVRPDRPGGAGQTGQLLDLYFAMTSKAGTWSTREVREWQQSVGLRPQSSITLRSAPGVVIMAATKD
jgi:SAM-dependent methyltransferase